MPPAPPPRRRSGGPLRGGVRPNARTGCCLPSTPSVVLNVAEKPSVARSLADVFSGCPGAGPREQHRHALSGTQVLVVHNVRIGGDDAAPHTMVGYGLSSSSPSTGFNHFKLFLRDAALFSFLCFFLFLVDCHGGAGPLDRLRIRRTCTDVGQR